MDTTNPNGNSVDDNTNLAKQYQDILDHYSKELAQTPATPPEPELTLTPPMEPKIEAVAESLPPITPITPAVNEIFNYPLNQNPVVPPAPPVSTPNQSNIFKYLFFVSLLIFLGVTGAVVYTLVNQNSSNQSTSNPTSTVTNTPTVTSEKTCVLNDKQYKIGESFAAADGCNTCTCGADQTIACTQRACDASPSAEKLTLTSVKPASGKVNTQITFTGTGFSTTNNSVVLASNNIEKNSCTFTYDNLPSADGKKIVLKLALTPSQVKCGGVEGSTSTSPTEILSGSYDVSIKVGEASSYSKAQPMSFKIL